jgi:hypothetical protein
MFYLGILPTFALLAISIVKIRKRWNLAIGVAAIPMIVAKLYFYDPVVWLTIGLFLFSNDNFKRHPARQTLASMR